MAINQKFFKKTISDFIPHHFFSQKSGAGFTLIETIVYIGLLSLIIGGMLPAVFQLLQSGTSLNAKTVVQIEGNFVVRKINWALTGVDPTQPLIPASGYSDTLSLTKYDGTRIAFRRVVTAGKGQIEISEDGGATYLPITTDNVDVSTLQFNYLTSVGTGPAGIEASTTISGLVVSTVKYIRK